MRSLVNLIGLSAMIAVCTIVAGWWSVPVVAGAWTLAAPRRGAVLYAAAAGGIAWGALLLRYTSGGAAGPLATLMGAIMNVPAPAFVLLTLTYAALLAGAAALVAQSLRPASRTARTP